MKAVAIRLEGQMQAWGTWCVGDDRPTHPVPTRSGVLGLVACCMGVDRGQTARLVELHRLCRVHVRVDRPGTSMIDDQTVQGLNKVRMSDGKVRASDTRATIQSKRSYLADASFAVLVVAEADLCSEISGAIRAPWFVPYLGRRACLPSTPLLALAPPSILEARDDDAMRLFAQVPLAERSPQAESTDFYLDGERKDDRTLRVLRQRDNLTGPLPRQFGTRLITHLRGLAPRADTPTNSIDPWMPT